MKLVLPEVDCRVTFESDHGLHVHSQSRPYSNGMERNEKTDNGRIPSQSDAVTCASSAREQRYDFPAIFRERDKGTKVRCVVHDSDKFSARPKMRYSAVSAGSRPRL